MTVQSQSRVLLFAVILILDDRLTKGEVDTYAYYDEEAPRMGHDPSNPMSTHVLDTAAGNPAAGINVILSRLEYGRWNEIMRGETNKNGRLENMIELENFTAGVYKLHFDTQPYFHNRGKKTFYPYIEVVFDIESITEHYHVPVLITAYGYSTYRGS